MMLQAGRSRVRFPMGSFGYFIVLMQSAALRSWVNLFSDRNEKLYLLAGKGDPNIGLSTLPSSCAFCLEIVTDLTSRGPKACTVLYRITLTSAVN